MRGRIVAVLFLVVTTSISFSQSYINAPYSRFGLGEVQNNGIGYTRSLAGTGTAFESHDFINFQNPALVQSTRYTIFDVGFNSQSRTISNETKSSKSADGGISHIAMTFSGQGTSKKWYGGRYAMGLGLMPYSTVNYNVLTQVPVQGSTTGETQIIRNEGFGNINKALLINSFKLYDNSDRSKLPTSLSLGLESSYLFGYIDRSSESAFVQDNYYTQINNEEHYRGLFLKPGIYFSQTSNFKVDTFKNKKGEITFIDTIPTHRIGFGATWSTAPSLQTDLVQSSGFYTTSDLPIDTNENILGQNVSTRLNSQLRFGLSYEKLIPYRSFKKKVSYTVIDSLGDTSTKWKDIEKTSSWKIGADLWLNNWDTYSNEFDMNTYQNSFGFSVGGEYVKDVKGLGRKSKYVSGIIYRFGVRYETLPYDLSGETVDEIGINLGFGLPLSINRAALPKYLNLNFEYARRGTTASGLIQEDMFTILMSFNVSRADWFKKRSVGL